MEFDKKAAEIGPFSNSPPTRAPAGSIPLLIIDRPIADLADVAATEPLEHAGRPASRARKTFQA
jgi:hypothetical protein